MRLFEIIRSHDLPGRWLYHVTSLHNLYGIAQRGLKAGSGTRRRTTYAGYEPMVKGKTFFATTPTAAREWFSSVHAELQAPDEETGNPKNWQSPARRLYWTGVMIRVPARDVEIDPFGDLEQPGSVYSTTKTIAPRQIQFWHPAQGWLPTTRENIETVEPNPQSGHKPPPQAFADHSRVAAAP